MPMLDSVSKLCNIELPLILSGKITESALDILCMFSMYISVLWLKANSIAMKEIAEFHDISWIYTEPNIPIRIGSDVRTE